MLDRDDWKDIKRKVIGGLILAGIIGVLSVFRDFVFTPVPMRPVWVIGSCLGIGGAIYFGWRQRSMRLLVERKVRAGHEWAPIPPPPKWKSYTQDSFLDVDWKWNWHGHSIQNLQPYCPDCGLKLYKETHPFDDQGLMQGVWLEALSCHNCNFEKRMEDPERFGTPEQVEEFVRRKIEQKAETMGYDPSAPSY